MDKQAQADTVAVYLHTRYGFVDLSRVQNAIDCDRETARRAESFAAYTAFFGAMPRAEYERRTQNARRGAWS